MDTVDDDIDVDGIKSRSHRIPQTSSESTLSDDLNISQNTEQSDDTVTEENSTSNGLTEYVEEEIFGVVLVLLVKAPDKLFLPFTGYTTRRSLLLALYTCQKT